MEFQFREFQNSQAFWGLGGIFQEFQIQEFQIQEFQNSQGILNSRCPLNFAVAAVKTRLQDFLLRIRWLLRTRWVAIFSFKAAALAVGRRSGSVRKSFATAFQAQCRKASKSFCVRRWAAQGFKAKKRLKAEPADKETELEFLGNSRLRNFRIPMEFCAGILVYGILDLGILEFLRSQKKTKQENGIFTILK